MPRTIRDILRGLLGDGSDSGTPEKRSQPIEIVSDPPVPPVSAWLDANRIRASIAKDVVERRDDDRSRAERREFYARTLGAAKLARPPVFSFGAKAKVKSAPRPKVERTAEVREYHREYMRRRRSCNRDIEAREPAGREATQ
jgi:hypothetical protein